MLRFLLPLLFLVTLTRAKDPNWDLTTPELIRRHGYPAESHTVQTDDGYLLTLHRIPPKDGEIKRTIFVQHGLLGSSADWILLGPRKSLAYKLADNGFDVWLGNVRGSKYSRAHVNLNPNDPNFWKFSWDEMALIDLPAMLDYVVNTTDQKTISYVGHSMGTTMFFALASSDPRYNEMIDVMVALAPVVYLTHSTSPLVVTKPFVNDIDWVTKNFGKGEFLPNNNIFSKIANKICNWIFVNSVCKSVLFEIAGVNTEHFDKDMLPRILLHNPAGTSVHTFLHFVQVSNSGNFSKFDFGKTENQRVYNLVTPPNYNLSAITTPIALFYGDNDQLVSLRDFHRLEKLLSNKEGQYLIPFKDFNHLDFLWAKNAPKLVYNTVLDVLQKNHADRVNY